MSSSKIQSECQHWKYEQEVMSLLNSLNKKEWDNVTGEMMSADISHCLTK